MGEVNILLPGNVCLKTCIKIGVHFEVRLVVSQIQRTGEFKKINETDLLGQR